MIRNALRRFMYGRYGNDQLNLFLLGCYIVLYLIQVFLLPRAVLLNWIGLLLAAAVIFRTLSRNLEKRRAENAKFLQLADPAVRWFRFRRTARRDKEHRYFRCPNCGQQLRVPRGKGTITVTCRSCGASFKEKS